MEESSLSEGYNTQVALIYLLLLHYDPIIMKYILILFIGLFFGSCVKDGKTTSQVILSNPTTHNISLYPYQNGFIDSPNIKTIIQGEEVIIEDNFQKGKTNSPLVFWDYFKPYDSLVVIWDGVYPITHFLSDTFLSSNKFIQFGASRNIGYDASYVVSSNNETKISIEWITKYVFSEQDFQFAKN